MKLISTIIYYRCELCGNVWYDNDDTKYVKCDLCGAKELRWAANERDTSNL